MPDLKTTTEPQVNSTAPSISMKKKAPGLSFRRFFTKPGVSPYNEVEWDLRLAQITDAQGNVIFEQKDVEVPKDWSMTATNIVASKYLHGKIGTPEREKGVRQLVGRVAETIRDWGLAQGYFKTPEDGATFHDELVHILVRQYAAFNSPVWFNVGCDRIEPNSDGRSWHWNPQTQNVEFGVTGYTKPQCSACFINSVKDSLDSILTLAKTEGMLFKWGSGTGTNLSTLRSSTETLSGGGTASGPLSFMKGFDAFAGVIKSGGKTRRAAKMVILNVDHPDIVDFVECKMKEEAKAHALVAQGYDGSHPDSDAYSSIFFQNANNSVRVTDDFMYAVVRDTDFSTKAVQGGTVMKTYKAKDLLKKISEATWHCGDPGMQYDTTVNRWHTSKNTARINASNPCSEYMFLDDSACNLASLNLLKFAPNGTFDVEAYRHAVDVLITAQEILVDNAGYPTESKSRRAADGRRPPLRLRRRSRLRRLRDGDHVRRSLLAVEPHSRTMRAPSPSHRCHKKESSRNKSRSWHRQYSCGDSRLGCPARAEPGCKRSRPDARRRLPRLVHQPRTIPGRNPHAPSQRKQHQQNQRPNLHLRSQQTMLGRSPGPRRKTRLPQQPGNGVSSNRHNRLHDGL